MFACFLFYKYKAAPLFLASLAPNFLFNNAIILKFKYYCMEIKLFGTHIHQCRRFSNGMQNRLNHLTIRSCHFVRSAPPTFLSLDSSIILYIDTLIFDKRFYLRLTLSVYWKDFCLSKTGGTESSQIVCPLRSPFSAGCSASDSPNIWNFATCRLGLG